MFWIILSIVLALLVIIILLGAIFAHSNYRPPVKKFEKSCAKEKNLYRISGKKPVDVSSIEISVKSSSGCDISAVFIPAATNDKAVILIHSSPFTVYGSSKYIEMFAKRGYNILVYNYRLQWKLKKSFCTYGYKEKLDIKACCDWIYEKCGRDCKIGLHGEHIGAAIAILAVSADRRIHFCIADTPFSDLREQIKYTLKRCCHIKPFPIYNISDIFYKLFTGIHYKNVSPYKEVRGIITPILFIHGMGDKIVPYKNSADLNDRKGGMKELYLASSAGHLKAYSSDPAEYERRVDMFLSKTGV